MIINYEGEEHEFPNDFTDQDISSALTSHEKEKKFDKIKSMLSNSPSNFLGQGSKEISGGLLNSLFQTGKMGAKMIGAFMPKNALSNISNLIPAPVKEKTSEFKNKFPELDPYKMMGTEEKSITTPGGALQTIGELYPGEGIINRAKPAIEKLNLPKVWETITKKLEPRSAALATQKGHDVLEKEASVLYETAKSEAEKRGVNVIPVSHKFLDDIIDSGYLANSKANKTLIEQAKKGNYEDLHKLQSDLWKKAKKGLGSESLAENNMGELISEKRNDLNDIIHNHFKKEGHEDISEMIKTGSDKWRNLKNTYYNHPVISKMVNKEEGRIIPKDPMSVFSEDSDRMRSFLKDHPEIQEKVDLYTDKNKLSKLFKKLGYGAVGLGAADLGWHGVKTLKDTIQGR